MKSPHIEELAIYSLWKNRDIVIPIRDNRLILIGENGSGKSTILKIMYYLLSARFEQLLELDFHKVAVVVDGDRLELTRDQIDFEAHERPSRAMRRLSPPSRRRAEALQDALSDRILAGAPPSGNDIQDMARHYGIPTGIAFELHDELQHMGHIRRGSDQPGLFGVDHARKFLKTHFSHHQILYLPTYRRVERDLRRLVPEFQDDASPHADRIRAASAKRPFGNEIAFGMQDVQEAVNEQTLKIERSVRQQLNDIAVQYLRDAILGVYREGNHSLEALDDFDWKQMLTRFPIDVGEGGLERVKGIAAKLKAREQLESEDQLVAHYIALLIGVWKHQRSIERTVRSFEESCNKYLVDKRVEYNDSSFLVKVRDVYGLTADGKGRDIEWGSLSSGEQQVVSLFSKLMLRDRDSYFLLIDEPELSLSVTWQPDLLPDVLRSGTCSGLFAVTHSPFIYDNELRSHATVVHDCTTPRSAASESLPPNNVNDS